MGGCVCVVRRACGCAASNGYFSDVIYFRARRTHSCASARSVLAHAQTSLRHDVLWRVVGVASARSFPRGRFYVGRMGTRGEGARRLRRVRARARVKEKILRARATSLPLERRDELRDRIERGYPPLLAVAHDQAPALDSGVYKPERRLPGQIDPRAPRKVEVARHPPARANAAAAAAAAATIVPSRRHSRRLRRARRRARRRRHVVIIIHHHDHR